MTIISFKDEDTRHEAWQEVGSGIHRKFIESGGLMGSHWVGNDSINFPKASPKQLKSIFPHGIIRAKNGYHGIIKKRTKFIVGERGAERVDITPLRKKHAFDYF